MGTAEVAIVPVGEGAAARVSAATAAMEAAPADRLRRLLAAPTHCGVAAWSGDALVGIVLCLRRPTVAMARLALFWVAPGRGDRLAIGRSLVEALAAQARADGLVAWRALPGDEEVLPAELLALAGLSDVEAGRAYRERLLRNRSPRPGVAGYFQTTGFTCGPASLGMALGGLGLAPRMDRALEIELWREATTVIGLTGPGGCDPYGLALAASRRGLSVRLFMSTEEPVLLDRGNSEAKRDLMRFVQADFRVRVDAAGIPVEHRPFAIAEIRAAVAAGAFAIVLVDQKATHGAGAPHWVLVTEAEDGIFRVNDPWVETDALEGPADAEGLPIREDQLDRMAWYGEPAYRAALLVAAP